MFTQDHTLFQDPTVSGTIITSILHVLQEWLLIIALYWKVQLWGSLQMEPC